MRPGVATTTSTPVAKRLDLALHVGAAVDGQEAHAARAGRGGQLVVDLQGQLAGGHQHERPWAGGARPGRTRSMMGRPKARVLPEPVLALPQTSRPARASGIGQGLDGERRGDAALGEGGHEVGGHAERVEGGGHAGGCAFVVGSRGGSASATALRHERRTVRMTRRRLEPENGGLNHSCAPMLAGQRGQSASPRPRRAARDRWRSGPASDVRGRYVVPQPRPTAAGARGAIDGVPQGRGVGAAGVGGRPRLQQLRHAHRRRRHRRGGARRARPRRHLLRHRRHLRRPGQVRGAARAGPRRHGATRWCWPPSSATRWATAPTSGAASRRYIVRAVEASLRRLQTDYIDLYQLHVPTADTPIDETLEALDDLVRAARSATSASPTSPAGRSPRPTLARGDRPDPLRHRPERVEPAERRVEHEVVPACEHFGVSVLPYFPLASGMLTGKYRRGEEPAGRHPPGRLGRRRRR